MLWIFLHLRSVSIKLQASLQDVISSIVFHTTEPSQCDCETRCERMLSILEMRFTLTYERSVGLP